MAPVQSVITYEKPYIAFGASEEYGGTPSSTTAQRRANNPGIAEVSIVARHALCRISGPTTSGPRTPIGADLGTASHQMERSRL